MGLEGAQTITDTEVKKRNVGGSVSATSIEVDFDDLCRVQETINKDKIKQEIQKLEVPIIADKKEERQNNTRTNELEIPIILDKKEERKNHVERKDISPEIRLPNDYEKWTNR